MLETSMCAENAPHEHASKPAQPPDRQLTKGRGLHSTAFESLL